MNNCKTCLYANELEDKRVFCDKVVLLYGKEVYIDADKVELTCPSHSDCFIPETRAYWNNDDMRDAEDSCGVCGRRVDLGKEEQYEYIMVEEGNSKVEKMQCSICKKKGRR